MSTKKAWLSEEEMYQVLEDINFFKHLLSDFDLRLGTLLKQPIVSPCGKRPDYIVVSSDKKIKYLFIIEVKITADLHTLSQIQKYENHIKSFHIDQSNLKQQFPSNVKIQKIIVARFFDQALQPFIDDWIGQEFIFKKLDFVSIDERKPNVKSWQIDEPEQQKLHGSESFKNTLLNIFGSKNESQQMVQTS